MTPSRTRAFAAVAILAFARLATAQMSAAELAERDYDPWEPLNRKVFWFNDQVDVWVLEPTARGWDFVAPDPLQRSISNFFSNLRFPIVTANNLFQGKPKAAATSVGRFVVNTTVGVAGFMDPATGFGLEKQDEDFGQTLGRWGAGPGPYLVLPLLGPSNPRDTLGLIADIPLAVTPFFVDSTILLGARVGDVVNERSLLLAEGEDAKQASLDYYTFVRNAYAQRRATLILDLEGAQPDAAHDPEVEPDEDDLYFPD